MLNGKVLLQLRNSIYQRIYKGEGTRGYVWRSTGTRDIEIARQKAMQFSAEIDYKRSNNIPLVSPMFGKVLDEYLAMREAQFKRGNYVRGKRAAGEQTSEHNLRQMKRMGRYLREFHGNTLIQQDRGCAATRLCGLAP